ncbi:Septal ring factor EnvC, activator of murein hydrolases AmiA and AmiB [Geosporobacter subterraneus DSM 17957]|uniref:Septal ring factor EnvC, activator of murein hydrolases AmiA and AmiB n=1 Tax=Geosporobacter subterraneus DSM 17957 TaxID=1121919 RepID=A0A1M6DB03_9FIRM|nr:peptidoglycan DD-metalloendopeptidase family protein [Geosporobacter subterraneus]SHI70432.1 Septal ring factor EnvC, activator of murein hydrolases AmiA and AmiB [Geosporobacter subterraneus DSM 17957]
MKGNRISLFLFTFVLMLTFSLEAFAMDVTSEQKKLEQLNKQIKNVQTKLVQNKNQEKNLNSQIKVLDQKIDQTEKEIGQISTDITLTQRKISQTKAELQLAEANINDKKDVLNARLRVMYKNGNVGYAEVLLDSANIVDLFSKLDMVRKIFNHDVDLLKYMKAQRDAVEIKKKTLESHQSRMMAMAQNMEIKQKELEKSRGEMSRVKSKLQQDNKQLEEQIDELNRYAQKIAEEIRRKQSKGEYVGGQMAWPAPGYTRVTSPFGNRIHPILKTKKLHTGIDIGIPSGKNVVAAGDGTVIHADWLGGYGKAVMIDHGGGIVTLYAHNSSLLVSEKDKVKRGDTIAKAGSTGMSTGPHLHFEVRKNGEFVDPLPWVK